MALNDVMEVICDSGSKYLAQNVILTCPVPQSLEILRASNLDYPAALDEIRYAKALVGLFEVERSSAPDATTSLEQGDMRAFRKPGNAIFSITNNQIKKISPSVN